MYYITPNVFFIYALHYIRMMAPKGYINSNSILYFTISYTYCYYIGYMIQCWVYFGLWTIT